MKEKNKTKSIKTKTKISQERVKKKNKTKQNKKHETKEKPNKILMDGMCQSQTNFIYFTYTQNKNSEHIIKKHTTKSMNTYDKTFCFQCILKKKQKLTICNL